MEATDAGSGSLASSIGDRERERGREVVALIRAGLGTHYNLYWGLLVYDLEVQHAPDGLE